MDKGKVVEFDQPFKLLVNNTEDKTFTKDSEFSSLIQETGEINARALFV